MNALRNSAAFFLSHPIARRQYLRTILRILSWQILSRLHSVITVRWIGGTKLTVSRGAKGATGNLYYGLHEFSPMAFTIHMLRPGDVFVDGGANIGTYTLLASAIAGAHTDAFEPDPGTIEHLAANIETNAISDRVTVHASALGDRIKRVSFTSGLDTMNFVSDRGDQTVQMTTLDSLSLSPALLKLDLEGSEQSAVAGAERTLRDPKRLAIICEDNAPEMAALLAEYGFERYGYDPFERRLSPEPRALPENGIFIRELQRVSARVSTADRTSVFGEPV